MEEAAPGWSHSQLMMDCRCKGFCDKCGGWCLVPWQGWDMECQSWVITCSPGRAQGGPGF